MHSSHEIGYPSAATSASSTDKLSNHLSGISTSVAEESFSRALASAIAHNATMTGSAAQDTNAPGDGLQQRSVAAIVTGAHGVGDKALDADFREAARIARWIAESPMFSLAATTSGHIQGQGRAEVQASMIEAQAKHGSRWHHELKPIGPVGET
ncbi:MAG: hypothetical protein HZB40_14080 [Rhodocyclales bacterium]|nr:hypothetical protein [Rhodocyclales bacterium]